MREQNDNRDAFVVSEETALYGCGLEAIDSDCLQIALRRAVDPRLGIIRRIYEVPIQPGAPEFFCYRAVGAQTGAFSVADHSVWGAGVSANRTRALVKALGETLEHYCGGIYYPDELIWASVKTADRECVRPGEFALYSKAQYEQPGFPLVRFEENVPIRWKEAIDISSGESLYVPASMVYVPYQLLSPEAAVSIPISTGMACHRSIAQAVINGICEVIERDAFTIFWQAMLTPPSIRVATLDTYNRNLVDRFSSAGYSVSVLNITSDAEIPTIAVALTAERSSNQPALVFAAAAHINPKMAVAKALEEAAQTERLSFTRKVTTRPLKKTGRYEEIRVIADHGRFYAEQPNRHIADFLFNGPEMDFEELPNLDKGRERENLKHLLERVGATGHRVLACDITTADVAELGYSTVRVLIPGFHPLYFGHKFRALGGSRLWTVPQKLGFVGIVNEDNPAPHPFL